MDRRGPEKSHKLARQGTPWSFELSVIVKDKLAVVSTLQKLVFLAQGTAMRMQSIHICEACRTAQEMQL